MIQFKLDNGFKLDLEKSEKAFTLCPFLETADVGFCPIKGIDMRANTPKIK